MKYLRSFLLPSACFATAWAVTFLVSRRGETPQSEPPANTRSSVSKARRGHDTPHRITGEKPAQDFAARPMSEWPKLWEEFASWKVGQGLTFNGWNR
jgi:hypothetical protein